MSPSDKSSLNPSSYTPLYVQIARMLRESIENGQYKTGHKLPSEAELVKQFGISRITATAALDELVKERLAYRERGRGTFVAAPMISDFSFFSSFTEDMLARGFRPSSRLVSLQVEKPDSKSVEKLRMDAAREYYCLVRVRLSNEEPVVLQRAYLPVDMYPNLEQNDFEKSYLFETMRTKYGLKPIWGEAVVEAGAASAEEASRLDVKAGTPVLIIWHLTLDDRFVPLEYVRSVYRADRFGFSAGRNRLRVFHD
jgi:GntR family transcriptional regulator